MVWHSSDDLDLEDQFGKQGEGPGEFSPGEILAFESIVDRGQIRWIHPADSVVTVFDGARVQRFTRDGQYIDAIDAALPYRPPQEIMFRGATIITPVAATTSPGSGC
jgi:hypothetical protein